MGSLHIMAFAVPAAVGIRMLAIAGGWTLRRHPAVPVQLPTRVVIGSVRTSRFFARLVTIANVAGANGGGYFNGPRQAPGADDTVDEVVQLDYTESWRSSSTMRAGHRSPYLRSAYGF